LERRGVSRFLSAKSSPIRQPNDEAFQGFGIDRVESFSRLMDFRRLRGFAAAGGPRAGPREDSRRLSGFWGAGGVATHRPAEIETTPSVRRWPDKLAPVEPLRIERKPKAVMPKDFRQIASAAPKNLEIASVGITLQLLLDLKRKPLHAAPHVRVARRDPDPASEIRRRTHVVRIFPNAEACLRLVRALAVETHENWLEAHRYLNMNDLREHKKTNLSQAA
jgi:putative transposase